MKASRLTAVGLVAAAGLWIASGHFLPHESAESRAAMRTGESEAKKLFRVATVATNLVPHRRKLTVAGRTEADKRVIITARTGGILTELRVKRGMWVKKNDVIAVLSDEAREAQVTQAQAMVTQKRTELEAKRQLILNGTLPRLQLVDLETQLRSAEAGLAGVKVGDTAEVRLVTGETASGKIRFVAKTASQTTRTYRVEIELPNADGNIPDGITAEVSMPQSPVPATRVPRSVLTISSAGDIGVRTVNEANIVGFVPVRVVEDEQSYMWVSGIADRSHAIVQGQDFVREGQKVEPVPAAELTATAK